jgi:hypothetical protein
VALKKSTGRWEARCWIGGKQTSLGTFGCEEEAARAWDRMVLWRCKADGKKEEEVQLNVPLSEYSDDEVTALQSCTQKEMIEELRRTEERVANQSSEYTEVRLEKSTGRWIAQCKIGGKQSFLGTFSSEEEAARACDRMRLLACKADGKKVEEVELKLNFRLRRRRGDRVAGLDAGGDYPQAATGGLNRGAPGFSGTQRCRHGEAPGRGRQSGAAAVAQEEQGSRKGQHGGGGDCRQRSGLDGHLGAEAQPVKADTAAGRGRDLHADGPRIRRRHERQPPRVRHLLRGIRRRRRHRRRRASHVLAVPARVAMRRVRVARVEDAPQAPPVPVVRVQDRLSPAPLEAVRLVERMKNNLLME